jgi:hypothetical protein
MEGTIDMVKIRVRSHAPSDSREAEVSTIDEAIAFLIRVKNGGS